MPTAVELTLSSLLPTISVLPPELLDLSASLLAQSRSKAATLKPEEEVARTYACCHIACQRLGHKLALEIAKPAPPVKPKVYNKLHAYFNSVLATSKTPRKAAAAAEAAKGDALTAGSAPGSQRKHADAKSDQVRSVTAPASVEKRPREVDEVGVPRFAMPLIRHICKACKTPDVAPHAFAGVQSILQAKHLPTKGRKNARNPDAVGAIEASSIPKLVLDVFLAVYQRMYQPYVALTTQLHHQIIEAVNEYCTQNATVLPFEYNPEETNAALRSDESAYTVPNAWLEMEWYQNIPQSEPTIDAVGGVENGNDDNVRTLSERLSKTPLRRQEKHVRRDVREDDVSTAPAGLLPGLGTMFQPAIDWLSHERKAQYAQWKQGIMTQLAVLEQRA